MPTENLTRITRMRAINVFLVREDDGLTLVDTAVGGSAKPILAAAERLGAPIVRILLTHAHSDHVGSLDALVARLPDAEVLISARDAKLLARDPSPEPGEPEDARKPRGLAKVAARAGRHVAPGDRVGSLEVHDAAGHSPGQLAFLDVRDRTLIAGDAYSTLGGVRTTAKPNPRFPLPGLATWHKPTALRSAQALRALEPRRLAVGHGATVEAPVAAMDHAIALAGG